MFTQVHELLDFGAKNRAVGALFAPSVVGANGRVGAPSSWINMDYIIWINGFCEIPPFDDEFMDYTSQYVHELWIKWFIVVLLPVENHLF